MGDREAVKYLAAWVPPDDIMAMFPNLEVLFSVGAGVDQFDFSTLPPQLPVVRMVEAGIINGMVEYASMAVLALHRDLLPYVAQRAARWQPIRVWPASARRVGILGLGLGRGGRAEARGLRLRRGRLEPLAPFDRGGALLCGGGDERPAFLA